MYTSQRIRKKAKDFKESLKKDKPTVKAKDIKTNDNHTPAKAKKDKDKKETKK